MVYTLSKMFRIVPLQRLPDNLDAFVEEVAAGLEGLYGPKAAAAYRVNARPGLESALHHPTVLFLAAFPADSGPRRFDDGEAAAIAMTTTKQNVAQIAFMHVLRGWAGAGVERALAAELVRRLREKDVAGILAEPVPMCRLDIDEAFTDLGFQRVERELMIAELGEHGLGRAALRETVTCDHRDLHEVADVIVDAYTGHPGRGLHAEVQTNDRAFAFVKAVEEGFFGPARAAYTRLIRRNGRCIGAIVGCEVAPEVGFILQVVVRRDWQRRGIGAVLIRELTDCFRQAGLERVALGVTSANPARRLYERMGFRRLAPVTAYIWWKEALSG
jgi:GNAT superfamily N-acetyltransferase